MGLALIFVFLILIIFSLIAFGFFIFLLDSLILRHDLPTSYKTIKNIVKIINDFSPSKSLEDLNFYDLGCGRGTVVLNIKKLLPELNVYGIDKNGIRIFFSKLKAFVFHKKINFIKSDIFNLDLSDADIIYTYLWYDLMPPLQQKLKKELKKGSIIITNTSHFLDWEPIFVCPTWPKGKFKDEDFEKLFVYKID